MSEQEVEPPSFPPRGDQLNQVIPGGRIEAEGISGTNVVSGIQYVEKQIINVTREQSQKPTIPQHFHATLSYFHIDAEWVESLAKRIENEKGLRIWLDKWLLEEPNQPWWQTNTHDLAQTNCCAICIGGQTPTGWFREEIQRAINRQKDYPSFRVILVLLPDIKVINFENFPEPISRVDFSRGSDHNYAFHLLTCGIKGVAPGRWPPRKYRGNRRLIKNKLQILRQYREEGLIDDVVAVDYQAKILDRYLLKDEEG